MRAEGRFGKRMGDMQERYFRCRLIAPAGAPGMSTVIGTEEGFTLAA
jgi:hypothetical protein